MGPDDWQKKMAWLRRMNQLYSVSSRGPGGGPVVPAYNAIEDEFYVALMDENGAELQE